jgi:diguanylate cyclase (GGDEF)-like protein
MGRSDDPDTRTPATPRDEVATVRRQVADLGKHAGILALREPVPFDIVTGVSERQQPATVPVGPPVSRVGADLFRRASDRVVAELGRRAPQLTWSVSRVESGHQVHLHVKGDLVRPGQTEPWDETLCHRMVGGGAHVVPDTLADPAYSDLPLAQRFRGYAGMPIQGEDGAAFGVLCGLAAEPLEDVNGVDEDFMRLLAGLLSDVLDGARLSDFAHAAERSAMVLAQTDHLTGLVNRRGWDLAMEQALEGLESYGDHMSVVIMDLDNLKEINDTDGHEAGDEVLQAVGRVLSSLVRRDDVVARIGGDEFGVLLRNCSETEAGHRAADIAEGLERAGVMASLGHATATTRDEFDTMVADADRAMYQAKSARRTITD